MGKFFVKVTTLLALFFINFACSVKPLQVVNLKTEGKVNPEGIDIRQPRFMWQLESTENNVMQQSYQLQVAESPEALEKGTDLLWDSGVVPSDNSINILYEGEELQSCTPYYWRVRVTTNKGTTQWSEIQKWSTAIFDPEEWNACWIGENAMSNEGETDKDRTRLAARYLRKEFENSDKKIRRAMLYISGLGSYEAYLNGERIGKEDVFAPMPSLYTEKVYYNVYDVTGNVKKSKNTLGVVLGNGRYFSMRGGGMLSFGLPSLLARLVVEYTDGTQTVVTSDDSWKVTSKGPIVANNEFDGEEYDARLEMDGWNRNGYDDSAWKKADLMKAPAGKLCAQPNLNLQIQEEIKPVSLIARPDGKYIVDMGQNMVGWLRVNLKGKAGQPISMKFAELLQPDSSLYLPNLRSANVLDIYTPAKDGKFVWQPSFVYHGFRFVEISGLEEQPNLSDFTGCVIYDKMATTGSFETSNKLVNQIHKNAYWGIRGNYRGMPTDCPQRDERLGWLGDRATGASGEAYIFDNANLYLKWLQDIEDSQSERGEISDVSPKYWTIYSNNVTWPSAYFYIADMLYRHFGEDRGIKLHYASMKKWMQFMEANAMQDYIIVRDQYGDWCMPPESQTLIHSQDPARKTDGAILSTTVYYDLLHLMVKFAKITGNTEDIAHYEELAAKMKQAYNEKYFNEETAQYGNNTVTANILSLRLGLVPEGFEERVFENIVSKTEKDFGGHVSTGVLGIQHLMRGLTEYGNVDLAYKIVTNDTYPSWGYMISKGATTIWELWNGDTADPAMNSANHVMLLGDLLIWMYEDLGGIKCAPDAVAFKRIVMQPVFPKGLDYVTSSYNSVYGKISSAWKQKDGVIVWDVEIPANTSAVLRFPKGYAQEEGAEKLAVQDAGDFVEVEIGSGHYQVKIETGSRRFDFESK